MGANSIWTPLFLPSWADLLYSGQPTNLGPVQILAGEMTNSCAEVYRFTAVPSGYSWYHPASNNLHMRA
jgi:hypothetical protein